MAYTAGMKPDLRQGYPEWEQELDSLLAAYGSEDFIRDILRVYVTDCPLAVQRLLGSLQSDDPDKARNAIHSLSNIMGIIGPASSRSLIERISANLKQGKTQAAAALAQELETLVSALMISIKAWLGDSSGKLSSGSNSPDGVADED